MHRDPKDTKHWRLSRFRYETFITFFKFRFFDKKRERLNFSMLTVRPSSALNSLTQPTRVHTPQSTNCFGLAQVRKINSLRLSPNLNSLPFIQNHKESQPIAFGHDVIHIPSPISYLGFYCDICDCHILPARV